MEQTKLPISSAKRPISWARIAMFAIPAGVVGAVLGTLLIKKNKAFGGIAGFLILGSIGAYYGKESSKGSVRIHV
ncbi:MAG: hypothetical protein PHX80_04615 [Candidatus Nanoarchaeia archaeon]|nr:hypothetical protein [Candidatus Nanoarchaeia archaeon]